MARARGSYFDRESEPLERRIATGLGKLGLAMRHRAWQSTSGDGLSPLQGQILALLARRGAQRPTDIALELAVKLPTVSESVRVLVDKGLLDRKRDTRDGRATLLALSPDGERHATAATSVLDFLAAAVDVLPPAEQEDLLRSLIKMIHALQQRGDIPLARMCVTCEHFRPHVHTGARPHHCAFVDAPMAARHLRLECADHDAADEATAQALWARFLGARR